MAFLSQSFDVSDLPQPSKEYSPLPAGWYSATISGAEVKETKAGTGEYIAVKYSITGPTHQGRVIFGNLNIKNPSPKAEEIGRQQLGDIMRAIGLSRLSDTDDFIGGKLSIKVQVTQSEQYGPGNDIRAWKAIEGSAIPRPTMPTSAPAQATSASSPPWAKK